MDILFPAWRRDETRSCRNKRRETLNEQGLSREAQQRSIRVLSCFLQSAPTQQHSRQSCMSTPATLGEGEHYLVVHSSLLVLQHIVP